MPYKFEYTKQKIPRELDRRVKLSKEVIKKIKSLYMTGNYSQRKLAQMFGCSRSRIAQLVVPGKREADKKAFAERQKEGRYYDKVKHTKSIREYRRYKQSIKGDLLLN